ncbi:MAG TPA: pyrrolo-quinoline quinone, partial [Gemmatales bacterium]|nr:pyrrolo-quinoline quinone [Gemmatales bacterium]
VPTGIVYQGQFVLVKDGGIVTAYDANNGEELYVRRLGVTTPYYASPVAANGFIYFTSLNDGIVTVMKAGSRSPEIVVKNPKLGEKVAATPAIAENTIYLRTARHLYAFAEQASGSKGKD